MMTMDEAEITEGLKFLVKVLSDDFSKLLPVHMTVKRHLPSFLSSPV